MIDKDIKNFQKALENMKSSSESIFNSILSNEDINKNLSEEQKLIIKETKNVLNFGTDLKGHKEKIEFLQEKIKRDANINN